MRVCDALIDSQIKLGGDPFIGRKLYPLVTGAGFGDVNVKPLFIYSDGSKPKMIDGFVRKTIIAMVEGVREKSINEGLLTREEWGKGIEGLEKTALQDGTFCYTFFRATACKK
jgi:hypothetical protein